MHTKALTVTLVMAGMDTVSEGIQLFDAHTSSKCISEKYGLFKTFLFR